MLRKFDPQRPSSGTGVSGRDQTDIGARNQSWPSSEETVRLCLCPRSARRPVQVTQDLSSFWKTGYAEVKKELKGRYPKHFWPDDPLQAPPTRGIKKR